MRLQDLIDEEMQNIESEKDTDVTVSAPIKKQSLQDLIDEALVGDLEEDTDSRSAIMRDPDLPAIPTGKKHPKKELDLFEYERTAAARKAQYAPIDDVLSDEEFLVDNVPDYLRPFVRPIASGLDGLIVKPTVRTMRSLNVGLEAIGETTTDAMAAFTKAVQDGIVDGGTFERLTGLSGKDIIPFSPETAGRKFTGDLIQLAEVSDAPSVAIAGAAKLGATAQMKALAKEAGAISPDIVVRRQQLFGGPIEEGSVLDKAVKSVGADIKTIKGGDKVQTAEMLARAEKTRRQREEKGYIGDIKAETRAVKEAKDAAAKAEAAKHNDILESVIHNYEDLNELERGAISKKAFGKTYIDYEKARKLGTQRVEDLGIDDDVAYDLGIGPKGFRNPILNPDKLNAAVATIAKVKELNPDAFKGGKNVIETLFRESVKGNLIASDELRKILDEFGLSMDEYIQMVVGSGSKFGKGLQKYAQMAEAMGRTKRTRSAGKKVQDELDKASSLTDWLAGKVPFEMGIKKTGQNIRRAENVSRGLMVSAFSTAARNLESTLIRMPLEGLTNLLQESIIRGVRMAEHAKAGDYTAARKEALKTVNTYNPLSRDSALKDSFGAYGYMFSDPLYADELTNFILEQPENINLLSRFRDQIVEAQKATGKGEGGISDFVFNPIEDAVDYLNTPNRAQEFLSRNAYFLSDLNRGLKREWGVSLEEVIRQGKMRELINDSPTLRPSRANNPPPSFAELAADAVESALDKTYASPPTFPVFKSALRVLNSIPGSTIAIPFPRFMFKAIEYVGANAAGGVVPALRLAMGKGNVVKDAEKVSRNIVGLGALWGLYEYRTSEDAPEEYNKVRNPDASMTNIDPQFPLAPGFFLAEAYSKQKEGGSENLTNWLFMDRGRNFQNGVKSLTGSNFRTNQTFGELLNDFSNMFAEDNDAAKSVQTQKAFGKALGNTVTRLFQPYSMVIDAERALGMRDNTYKMFEGEPDLSGGSAFVKGFMLPINQRGYVSIDKEAKAPAKQFAMGGEKERIGPTWKLFLGANIERGDKPWEKYLKSLNYVDYDFASKTGIKVIDNTMNALYNELLEDQATMLMNRAPYLKKKLKAENRYSEKMFVLEQRNRVMNNWKEVKKQVANAQYSGSSNPPYVKAVNEFRKIAREDRIIALNRLQAARDSAGIKPVNLGSTQDLYILIQMARNIGKEK